VSLCANRVCCVEAPSAFVRQRWAARQRARLALALMSADEGANDPDATLRRDVAERAIGEGRKRYALTIGELFPDGDAAAAWVFALTVLAEDISVLLGLLSRAREREDLRESLVLYRQLVTRLYEARRVATTARTVPEIASFVGDLLRRAPAGIDLEEVYRRDPETNESTVEHLYGELRHRTVHYFKPGSQELADVLWNHSGYPAQLEIAKDDRGRPTVWFQWVHAVTAMDLFGDVTDTGFLKFMNERSQLLTAIAMSWLTVAATAVMLHVHRLGIDSSRLGHVPEPPVDSPG
jgi:hypothetical protein